MRITIFFTVFYLQLFSQTKQNDTISSFVETAIGLPSDGLRYIWYPSGAKLSETEYRNGYKCGKYLEWHENGNLKTSGTFDTITTKNLRMFGTSYFKSSQEVGVWKTYDVSGQVLYLAYYKEGKLIRKKLPRRLRKLKKGKTWLHAVLGG